MRSVLYLLETEFRYCRTDRLKYLDLAIVYASWLKPYQHEVKDWLARVIIMIKEMTRAQLIIQNETNQILEEKSRARVPFCQLAWKGEYKASASALARYHTGDLVAYSFFSYFYLYIPFRHGRCAKQLIISDITCSTVEVI